MAIRILKFFSIVILLAFSPKALSQEGISKKGSVNFVVDSLAKKGIISNTVPPKPEIDFGKEKALKYLQEKFRAGNWDNNMDPLRLAIGQLIYAASHEPYDSAKAYLQRYKYDSINIPWSRFYSWDSLKVKIPVLLPAHFVQPGDTVPRGDTIGLRARNDSLRLNLLDRRGDSTGIYKPTIPEPTVFLKDTIFMVIADTLKEVLPLNESNPFRSYRYPYQGDSLAFAIKTLTEFIEDRDSSIVNFRGVSESVIPVWLNSKSDKMVRYWLKNEFADSVTVWIGSTGRNTIGLFLEEGILFRRPVKQTNISDAQLNLKKINSASLQDVNKIYIKPHYWKFRTEASFVLNQATLVNWVKGGESSISTTLDVTGYADYNNKKLLLSSNNFARLKYGLVASGGNGIRKNLDLLETNSKLNHKAFGKFDFSGTVLFKTQVTKGWNYTKINGRDTSLLVSKFMSPAILTIGLGLDYKPNKTTSINFAPLSYKGTFVGDTANIDQTKYGIPHDRKSKHEPGVSLQISHELKLYKTITVLNRLQLFTNYIDHPQNVDIDWEMIATTKLNWFTEVRLNTHFIFDDNTKIPVVGKDGKPVMVGGIQKKTARIQFKELIGLSFVFKF
jgi:hypothetical protein